MNGQTVLKAFVPLPGGATAVYSGSTLGWYRHPDWLGSSRIATTSGGALYYDGAYAPFGETMGETGTADRSFTGQNQDLTAYLYDFPFREYDATRGRWLSPDPAGLAAADPSNPQSWNRYGYVNNSPLNLVDPLGLWTPTPGSGGGSGGGFTGGSYPGGFPMSPNCQQVFWSLSSSIFRGFIDTGASAVFACIAGLQAYRPGPGSSSAGGDAGRDSILGKVKAALCSVLPSGRVTSLNGGIGGIGGQTGSLSEVVNYNTGEISRFASGGFQGGWNGVASASFSMGYVWNMPSNKDYSGPFKAFSAASKPGFGGSVAWASNGVLVITGSAGLSVIPSITADYSYTWTTKPLNAGKIWTKLPPLDPVNMALALGDLEYYAFRQLCQ